MDFFVSTDHFSPDARSTTSWNFFIHDAIEKFAPASFPPRTPAQGNLYTRYHYGSSIWCREVLIWQIQSVRDMAFLTNDEYEFRIVLDDEGATQYIQQARELLALLDGINFSHSTYAEYRTRVWEENHRVIISGSTHGLRTNGLLPEIISTIILCLRYELFKGIGEVTQDSVARMLMIKFSSDYHTYMWPLTAMFVRMAHKLYANFGKNSGPASLIGDKAKLADYVDFVNFVLKNPDAATAENHVRYLSDIHDFCDAVRIVREKGG